MLLNYVLPVLVYPEIVSDNDPQFIAQNFSDFCRNNGIKHTLIAPYNPATNGAAERAVQVIKQAVKKMDSGLSLTRQLARFLLIIVRHLI